MARRAQSGKGEDGAQPSGLLDKAWPEQSTRGLSEQFSLDLCIT